MVHIHMQYTINTHVLANTSIIPFFQASSKLTEELKHQNELLQQQLAGVERYVQQLEASRDRADAYLSRLAGSMDGMLGATLKGNTRVCGIVLGACQNVGVGGYGQHVLVQGGAVW